MAQQIDKVKKEEQAVGCKCLTKDTRFDKASLDTMQTMFEKGEFAENSHVIQLTSEREKGPKMPEVHSMLAVMTMPYYVPAKNTIGLPWWVPPMAHFRRKFAYNILRFERTSGEVNWYYFSYSMQNPLETGLMKIWPYDNPGIPDVSLASGNNMACLWHPWMFSSGDGLPEYTHEYDKEAQDVKDISILCGVTQQQYGFLVSRAEPIPFYGFIAQLGDVPKRSLTRRKAPNTTDINKLNLAKMFPCTGSI